MSDAQFYNIAFELYRHADYLRVQGLKIAVMEDLEKRLDRSAEILFSAHWRASDPEWSKNALHDPMTAAVAVFDKSNEYYVFYEPLRAKIFDFVERCYPVLCRRGDEFEDYLRKAPELSLAVLKKMRNIEKSQFIAPGPDARCMFCNERIWQERPSLYFQPKFGTVADINGSVRYFCSWSECFRKVSAKRCFNGN